MRIAALERIQKLRGEIEKCAEMESDLRAAAERMTQLLSGMPLATPSAYSRVEEYTLKILQTQETRQRLEIELLTEQVKLSERISSVIANRRIRQIIRKRYIEGKSWRAIGAELYCTTRQILRLNREGLRQLGAGNVLSA